MGVKARVKITCIAEFQQVHNRNDCPWSPVTCSKCKDGVPRCKVCTPSISPQPFVQIHIVRSMRLHEAWRFWSAINVRLDEGTQPERAESKFTLGHSKETNLEVRVYSLSAARRSTRCCDTTNQTAVKRRHVQSMCNPISYPDPWMSYAHARRNQSWVNALRRVRCRVWPDAKAGAWRRIGPECLDGC